MLEAPLFPHLAIVSPLGAHFLSRAGEVQFPPAVGGQAQVGGAEVQGFSGPEGGEI